MRAPKEVSFSRPTWEQTGHYSGKASPAPSCGGFRSCPGTACSWRRLLAAAFIRSRSRTDSNHTSSRPRDGVACREAQSARELLRAHRLTISAKPVGATVTSQSLFSGANDLDRGRTSRRRKRFFVHAEEKLTAFLDPAYSVGSPRGQTQKPTTNRGIWRKFKTLM